MVHLCKEVLNFEQKSKEPLGVAWARLSNLSVSGPDLAIPNSMLLHFYMVLSKESSQFLDITSGGAFLQISMSEGRLFWTKSLKTLPTPEFMTNSPRRMKNQSSSNKKFLTTDSMPIQPIDPVVNQTPEPPKEEEIPPPEEF